MEYDLVIVGGGLAGAALATVMARAGARVLVLERETRFRDRIRGETIHPWGVAELRALGLEAPLLARCARPIPWWATMRAGEPLPRRDLVATTPQRSGSLDYFHPDMQETLIALAAESGAEVRRGDTVTGVTPGERPRVAVTRDGTHTEVAVRLVVGADGRSSRMRGWAGFPVQRERERIRIAGLLFTDIPADEDAVHLFLPPDYGYLAMIFPLGGGRFRAYFSTARREEHVWLSGAARVPDFIRYCITCGVPADWFAMATVVGPLATFEGAPSWVTHPYRDGVALIGDAAGASDPDFGHGQSLTLRDVRVLSGLLLEHADWEAAGHAYAAERDRYFGALHTLESWMTEIRFGTGPEADRIREHALPHFAAGTAPDLIALGPDQPTDEAARLRFLGR